MIPIFAAKPNLKELSKFVTAAIRQDPKRLKHGDQRDAAFFVGPQGEFYSWKDVKWGQTVLKNFTCVHSHLNVNFTEETGSKIHQTFSIVDVSNCVSYLRFGIVQHAVITSTSTMDVLQVTPKFVSSGPPVLKRKLLDGSYDDRVAFHNLNKGKFPDHIDTSSVYFREKLRTLAPSMGLVYVENVPFKF